MTAELPRSIDGRNPETRHPHEDRGAALILAIAFVVMIGTIGAGMASLVSSSLNNRGSLERVRDREYAADAAVEDAIVQVRNAGLAVTGACQSPTGASIPNAPINSYRIRVDWRSACGLVTTSDGVVLLQRNVIFSACDDTDNPCVDENVIIRAQVNFDQSATGGITRTYVQSWSVNQ